MKKGATELDSLVPITIVTGGEDDALWMRGMFADEIDSWNFIDLKEYLDKPDGKCVRKQLDSRCGATIEAVLASKDFPELVVATMNIGNKGTQKFFAFAGSGVHRPSVFGKVLMDSFNSVGDRDTGRRIFNANLFQLHDINSKREYDQKFNNISGWPWSVVRAVQSEDDMFGCRDAMEYSSDSAKGWQRLQNLISQNFVRTWELYIDVAEDDVADEAEVIEDDDPDPEDDHLQETGGSQTRAFCNPVLQSQ